MSKYILFGFSGESERGGMNDAICFFDKYEDIENKHGWDHDEYQILDIDKKHWVKFDKKSWSGRMTDWEEWKQNQKERFNEWSRELIEN